MRILVDYRPALRARTGVGEYIHELVRAYTGTADAAGDTVTLFTSSWADRPNPEVGADLRARVVDRRIPVRLLNALWHRAEWPPVERLAGPHDVVHSAHPLLMPARHAARVITIHDLFFLNHPERTRAEIRRDYPRLAAAHAQRADAIVTSSAHVGRQIREQLHVPDSHIYVCPPGAPAWSTLGRQPHTPRDGAILFLGTLEPRKNLGVLLDAYTRLLHEVPHAPRLMLAGRATADAAHWLNRLNQPPLQGHVVHLGYVPDSERERTYASARVLVLPSLDEGFGLPVLEAMAAGLPVVVSNRGSLPDVVGHAGVVVEPDDVAGLTHALARIVTEPDWAETLGRRSLERAKTFTWTATALTLRRAYLDAIERRRARALPAGAR